MDKFTFTEFVSEVQEYFAGRYESAEIKTIQKSDGEHTALVIRQCVTDDIAPAIYLESFYNRYEQDDSGDAFAFTMDEIEELYEKSMNRTETENLKDKAVEAVKNWRETVQAVLVNKEQNEAYLEDKITKDYLDDMVVYYKIVVDTTENDTASVAVNRTIFANMDTTIEELDEIARENTRKNSGVEFKNVAEVLAELTGMPKETFGDDLPMYVLTNRTKVDGAILFTYEDIMHNVCEVAHAEGMYILPSSRHEIICVPINAHKETESLRKMVSEVNDTQVPPGDLLSYGVFKYMDDTREITQVE